MGQFPGGKTGSKTGFNGPQARQFKLIRQVRPSERCRRRAGFAVHP
jgi:hypothetical protein